MIQKGFNMRKSGSLIYEEDNAAGSPANSKRRALNEPGKLHWKVRGKASRKDCGSALGPIRFTTYNWHRTTDIEHFMQSSLYYPTEALIMT